MSCAQLNQGDSNPLFLANSLLPLRVLSPQYFRLTSDSIDSELSAKLAEELKLEGSMDEGLEIPPSIQEYLEKGPFKVIIC
jgi:hypothetical protein